MRMYIHTCTHICLHIHTYTHIYVYMPNNDIFLIAMGWLQLEGSSKLQVSCAKEPYNRDDILQKRPIILRSLLIVATPYLQQQSHGICICTYICMYIRISVYMYTCICPVARPSLYTYTYILVYKYIYIYKYLHIYILYIYMPNNGIPPLLYIISQQSRGIFQVYICTVIYLYVHMYICIQRDEYMNMYLYMYIHNEVYMYMHIYIYVCIHILYTTILLVYVYMY